MSFHEISIAVRAENRASYAFRSIVHDVLHLGSAFGLFDSQVGKTVGAVMSTIHLFTSLRAVLATTTPAQIAQAVSAKVAAAATWALNAALAMKIALLTLGVGLIVATAAYMSWLASSTREAAAAQAEYNAELDRTPVNARSVRRAGEEEYYRRGVEY